MIKRGTQAEMDPYIRSFQNAQDEAHSEANKSGVAQVVFWTGEDEFSFAPEAMAPPKDKRRVQYLARPETITYRQYRQECDADGMMYMSLSEWAKEGRLSLADYLHKHGLRTKADHEAEKKEQRKKAAAEESPDKKKAKKALKAGKSNKLVVFDAYSAGETNIETLINLTGGAVKVVTVKSWIGSWKKGNNLPAGRELTK